ncbi:MAG TPA: hypothetical protein VL094_05200, partial [Sphingomonadaceae bacterium]|nr:hypothetical protein [Sphingomonadaceae bacterium]
MGITPFNKAILSGPRVPYASTRMEGALPPDEGFVMLDCRAAGLQSGLGAQARDRAAQVSIQSVRIVVQGMATGQRSYPQWLYRNEALARLLGHPDGELAVISTCAALAADPSSQVVIDPLMVLEATKHHEAAVHVLQQIREPASTHAQRAAWWVAAEKVTHGHFSAEQRRTLARQAIDVMVDSSGAAPHRIA